MASDRGDSNSSPALAPQPSAMEGQWPLARARAFGDQDDGEERVAFSTVEAIVMESGEVCDALWQQLDAFAPHAIVRPPSLPRELV